MQMWGKGGSCDLLQPSPGFHPQPPTTPRPKKKFLYMRMLSRGKMTAIGGGWMEGYYVWAEAKNK